MEKRLIQLAVLALVLYGVWHFWDPLWRYDINEAVDKNSTEKVIFQIAKGENAKEIAKGLDKKDLIVDFRSFLRTVESEDLSDKLRYGKFVLSPNMTIREIVTVLTTQGTGEMAITVKEGETIEDIDAELADLGLIKKGDFKLCTFNCKFDRDNSLEGFLFPDTYFLDGASFSVQTLINQMLTNFENKISAQMLADIAGSKRSLRDIIIVASMLEKEVNYVTHPDDTDLVAGIIWKRLDNDWTLGIDATMLYFDNDGELSLEELADDNAYNSRLNKGLPPTAVSNPGLDTITAAIYPESSGYWFYLTDPESGDTIFAITNEEHEANKAHYL